MDKYKIYHSMEALNPIIQNLIKGDVTARLKIQKLYYREYRNSNEIIILYKKNVSAITYILEQLLMEKDNAYAQNQIGHIYHKAGELIDFKKAMEWYLKSAQQDNLDAHYNIGKLYEGDYEENYVEAMKWHMKAAEKDHVDAQYSVGTLYGKGTEITTDSELEEVDYNPFVMSSRLKPSVDYKKSMEWLLKAATAKTIEFPLGHPGAQRSIGSQYYHGIGVDKNVEKSIPWIKMSADQNYPAACNDMGYMYNMGSGVEKNIEIAMEWYIKGLRDAMFAENNLQLVLAENAGCLRKFINKYIKLLDENEEIKNNML